MGIYGGNVQVHISVSGSCAIATCHISYRVCEVRWQNHLVLMKLGYRIYTGGDIVTSGG